MSESVTSKLIDAGKCERAAARVVLAYELGDALASYTDDQAELFASALSTVMVVLAYGLSQANVTQKQSLAEFTRVFKSVEAALERLGPESKLIDVMTELHLDHTPDRKRRK